MIQRYEAVITRMFYPNIALGTAAFIGIPALLGALVGGKNGAAVGGVAALIALKLGQRRMQQQVHAEET